MSSPGAPELSALGHAGLSHMEAAWLWWPE
jgi:hypothetical protein